MTKRGSKFTEKAIKHESIEKVDANRSDDV